MAGLDVYSQKHLRRLGSRLVASAAEERDKACVVGDGRWIWVGTGLGREDGGERDGRRMDGEGLREGRWRGARREAHGWGRGWGGKMEGSETREDGDGAGRKGSETGGAWLGTGLGAWVGTGLGREDGGGGA